MSNDAIGSTQGPRPFERPRQRAFNKELALATLKQYQAKPLHRDSNLAAKTKQRRDRIWRNWQRFAEEMDLDPNGLWIDLCVGEDVQSIFQTFLRMYVEGSITKRPCLGPEEYKEVRTIQSACTVEDTWTLLVNEAQSRVLDKKRIQDPENAGSWRLLASSRDSGHGNGKAYDISRWIPHLAIELGLSLEQSFEKSEMRADDVIFCLDTVWTRAKHIPCRPSIRFAFHCATLLGGIGGWRPGSLVNIRYEDVEFAWVRDLKDPLKTWPVVYTTIHHVKQRAIRIQRDQRSKLKFAMGVVPHKLLCLVTLFTMRAIVDNAFEAGYHSCDQVLRPGPLEEGVDFVRLNWRDEVIQKKNKIVPISYNQFLDIWNRVHFVAGSRETKRPYTLRVGAGGRLDGSLASAVRNYILSNSTEVFERSYQPVLIRQRLSEIAFGELGKQDDGLWSVISNAFLRRDPYAPLYLTQEESDKFEERNDIRTLRQGLIGIRNKHGLNSKEEGKVWGRIQQIYDSLEKLVLHDKRRDYFAEVDRLRAQGKSTIHLYNPLATNPRRTLFKSSNAAAEKLSSLLTNQMPPATLSDKLVEYLRSKTPECNEDAGPTIEDSNLLKLEPPEKPRCLFGCGEFFNKTSLTRHVKQTHDFKHPFSCPECMHLGLAESWIEASPCAWSNHVERIHGKTHAPNVQPNTMRRAYCPLCVDIFAARGFTQHLNKKHSEDFSHPFQCPECRQQEQTKECLIGGRDFWLAHVREAHGGGEIPGAMLVSDEGKDCKQLNITRKRKEPTSKLEEGHVVDALPRKRLRLLCDQLTDESDCDWKAESPDPHADEEFWVEGRD
ncbi:hypothetical protein CI102_4191 [Trichoderma harzianum]|nr:hypothetical protein CI102_4191 [Trichoderma harzianum]